MNIMLKTRCYVCNSKSFEVRGSLLSDKNKQKKNNYFRLLLEPHYRLGDTTDYTLELNKLIKSNTDGTFK